MEPQPGSDVQCCDDVEHAVAVANAAILTNFTDSVSAVRWPHEGSACDKHGMITVSFRPCREVTALVPVHVCA